MEIEIIHQTKDYLVLNKPTGLSMHKDGKREEETLADWVLQNFPQTKDVGEKLIDGEGREIDKPGIVHRLDKDTSGIILIALTQDTYEYFKNQFKDREVQKVYHLFAYGNWRDDLMTVKETMGKDKKDFRKRSIKNPRGKVRESETNFRILKRGKEGEQLFIFVEARPKTGRTHQIRVHMKHINTAIVKDRLYAPKGDSILGFQRLALHARKLLFRDPDGVDVSFEAPYPADFKEALDQIDLA